ncbi:MAG: hypothetical protein N2441_01805 [Rhodocyclaceae bacterium]|nr:hypothetical protein [Rhodocyclaceae bacterium]
MRLPLSLALPYPRRLAGWLVVAYATALGAAAMTSLAWPWRALIMAMLMASAVGVARRLSEQAGRRMTLGKRGEIELDGQPAQLTADAVAWPWLAILPLQSGEKQWQLIITSDMLPDPQWRGLLAWLRWRALTGDDAAG